MDRFADIIFQNSEDKIRIESGMKAESTILVWKKYEAGKYAEYARLRIRILRASMINVLFI